MPDVSVQEAQCLTPGVAIHNVVTVKGVLELSGIQLAQVHCQEVFHGSFSALSHDIFKG